MEDTPLRTTLKVEAAIVATVVGLVAPAALAINASARIGAISALLMGGAAFFLTYKKPAIWKGLLSFILACGGIYLVVSDVFFSKASIQKEIASVKADKSTATQERDEVAEQRNIAAAELEKIMSQARDVSRELQLKNNAVEELELSTRSLSSTKSKLTFEVESLKKQESELREREKSATASRRRADAEAEMAAAKKAELEGARAKAKAIADAEAEEAIRIKRITGTIPKFPKIAAGAALKEKGADEIKKCRWQKDTFGDTYYLAFSSNGAPVIIDPANVVLITPPFEGADINYARGLSTGSGPAMLIGDECYVTVSTRS